MGELGNFFLKYFKIAESGDVEHRHEAAVVVPAGRLDAVSQPGQQAGKNLDHGSEAVALVALGPAQRQQRAVRLELLRIGGGLAVAIDDPALGDRLAAGDGQADLAGGHGGGRHVEEQRAFEVGRHRERDRVGAKPCLGAAIGRDMLGAAAAIGRDHGEQAFLLRHQRIGGEAANMALAKHRAGGDVLLFSFFDGQLHRSLGGDVAKAPVPVDDRGGWRFLGDHPRRAGHDVADLHTVDIGGDLNDAVAVMAGQVGLDTMARNDFCFVGRCASGLQQGAGDLVQAFRLDCWHVCSSLTRTCAVVSTSPIRGEVKAGSV